MCMMLLKIIMKQKKCLRKFKAFSASLLYAILPLLVLSWDFIVAHGEPVEPRPNRGSDP